MSDRKVISYGVSVDDDNGYHVHFRLHAGLPGSRGLAGSLCLTKDEFEDFVIRIGAGVHR